jgi:two-component system, chemotaxis family, CheB/CheR fusion protein
MGKKTTRAAIKSGSKTAKKRSPVKSKASFPIVAIGASAGGVEASSELLKNIAVDLGMAYVFIHHLSSTHESHLTEILQRVTSMGVHKATARMKVVANNVYVAPSNTVLSIEDGYLIPRLRTKKDVNAIDHFLVSLANTHQHRTVGILLSGTSSDGTVGLKAIKLQGGLTFAQDETAQHHEMSWHAQEAGFVDYVLPAHRIGKELGEIVTHPYVISPLNEAPADDEKGIKKILSIVLERFDVDFFSHYKRTTVNRRIMRRMALNKVEKTADYIKKLKADPKEVNALYNDFLINVTSFFREPHFYLALKKAVFPQLVKDRKSDPIRIWIPGCATGEEAYSTAIVITEFLEEKKLTIPVHIFSTDLDERAIAKARVGLYPKSALTSVSHQRQAQFFTSIDGHLQVTRQIRDMCTFSVHNLMKDPPFSRIDLVSCQNVLIYIEAAPQRKILQSFHYALRPNGFLLLGKSESVGNASELFYSLSKDARLYRKKIQAALPRLDFAVHSATATSPTQQLSEHRTESDIEREFDKVLLSRYVPASVLVNKDLEILRFRGNTNLFLQPPSGKASFNLLKMLKEELIFEIRALLQKVRKTNLPAGKDEISIDSEHTNVAIEVLPIKSLKEIYFLIVFKPGAPSSETPGRKQKTRKSDEHSKIQRLEQSLRDAREQVRTITEDFDVSREELQSANEEILSSNEELQSINEELETSKEELQSANEELTTINEELQNRIDELRRSYDYTNAIIDTMHEPLVVVSGQMRVRTANKAFYEFFRLKPDETEGMYLHELHNGQWDIPTLASQLRQMFPKKLHFNDFEISHTFPGIGHRIMFVNARRLSYGKNAKDSQVLLAFQDITRFRTAEAELKEAQEQLKLTLEGGSVGIWSWNLKTNEVTGSKEEAEIFGLHDGHFFKTYSEWLKALHPEDSKATLQAIESSIAHRVPLDLEFRILTPEGNIRWILTKANVYYDRSNKGERMMGINIDITERKRAVEAIAESEKRFHALSENAPVMIWMSDADQNCNYINRTWLLFTGKSLEDEVGHGWHKGIHPEDRDQFLKIYAEAHISRKPFQTDYRLKRHDGEYRWIMAHGVPRYLNEETFGGFIGTCMDITDRINLEKQKDDFMSIASHELKTPVTSIKAYTQILHERFKKMNDENTAMMLGRLDSQIDKLTELINTLLDVARLQSRQMDYDHEEVSVYDFVKEIAEDLQGTFSSHQIVLELKGDGEMITDKARIAQVLTNLVSNAVKYSPGKKKVVLKTISNRDAVTFTVQDFGIGIAPEIQGHIFDRFFRASESEGNRVSGLGLGLYITAQIIRQQGGDIWLESTPGKGSSFFFSIPRTPKTDNGRPIE